ncbi:Mur ligase domain-containing protein [Serratia nevei]|uniref:Mur ligase domain-containing protein n=1 Tax=Serratia nevei TaxID=2703794 RepID=UPI00313ED3EE
MRIHILGICGTFMGGLAMLARSLGHDVTGSDANVYPPMSTLLENQGIDLIQGYDPAQLDPAPDLVIIGNAMTRGNPCVEAVLERGIPYVSGPQWLHDAVLRDRWVLAVAGTHGKTTTAGMATWILEACGYQPGFVIGGVQPADACRALGDFINARRRLELRGEANGVTVYDDFAHHPTAILATLAALRGKVGGTARILAVLEPRSNTMKMGISKNDLAPSLGRADEVFLFQPHHIPWQVAEVADACVQPAHWSADLDTLVDMVVKTAQPGDHILVMSNGGFGGIHDRLLDVLAKKQEPKVTY